MAVCATTVPGVELEDAVVLAVASTCLLGVAVTCVAVADGVGVGVHPALTITCPRMPGAPVIS